MANPSEAEKYEVLEKIGHGSFGIIHKVRRVSDTKILCRKEISYLRMSQKEREQLHAEFSILHSLCHPNIVGYYHREHLKATQELHIYMEYCDGGDLSKVIKSLIAKNQFAEEEYVWSIFTQLVTALYRCHYGLDPPEVGKNFMGAGNVTKPYGLRPKNQIMILHRDLKPDNVFLGADNSVKLGDFGLSKLMQSHDFASTYVGTPYYMSPEICAAEKYTLHSDIWSLGCIMYELCMRRPPFDAKTHFHLVQKIKEGKFDPLPSIYSAELQNVIKSCLKTNPNHRPDTAALLNLPVVRLMRKEREVVEVGRLLKLKDAETQQALEKLKIQIAQLDLDKSKARIEIESTVRREWEVKARLEIDRLVQLETASLQKRFDTEFQAHVQEEVEKHLRSLAASAPTTTTGQSSETHNPSEIPQSSISTADDLEFSSQTDLTSLSFESPLLSSTSQKPRDPLKKSTRTPFTRARTTYDSPMDVHMASPSPMSITSLALSPRRHALPASALPNPTNIFAAAAEQRARWEPHGMDASSDDDDSINLGEEDDEDELPDLPSPTRVRKAAALASDPFKLASRAGVGRPGMRRQSTAPMPMPRLQAQPSLFSMKVAGAANAMGAPRPRSPQAATAAGAATGIPTSTSQPALAAQAQKPVSPTRRMSKVPFLAADASGSPTRRPSVKKNGKMAAAGGEEMLKAVVSKNMFGAVAGGVVGGVAQGQGPGRTLVELNMNMQQGRAVDVMKAAVREVEEEKGKGSVRMAARVLQWESKKGEIREEVVWDPERDEMPSPFLARKGRGVVR
ncbi:G2-specific serine/threonine protein kinase [Trapelia coarctata]|nr:G2-specific serine/threonine protein kinase [Trapelia coarctata]